MLLIDYLIYIIMVINLLILFKMIINYYKNNVILYINKKNKININIHYLDIKSI